MYSVIQRLYNIKIASSFTFYTNVQQEVFYRWVTKYLNLGISNRSRHSMIVSTINLSFSTTNFLVLLLLAIIEASREYHIPFHTRAYAESIFKYTIIVLSASLVVCVIETRIYLLIFYQRRKSLAAFRRFLLQCRVLFVRTHCPRVAPTSLPPLSVFVAVQRLRVSCANVAKKIGNHKKWERFCVAALEGCHMNSDVIATNWIVPNDSRNFMADTTWKRKMNE